MGKQQIELRGTSPWEHLRWTSRSRLCFGRMKTCEAVVEHSSVSRRHAEVIYTPQGWMIRDLGSKNGSSLNGARLGRMDHRLHLGDRIQLGDISLAVVQLIEEVAVSSASVTDGMFFEVLATRGREAEPGQERLARFSDTAEGKLVEAKSPPLFLGGPQSLENLLYESLQRAGQSLAAQGGLILLAEENSQIFKPQTTYGMTNQDPQFSYNKKIVKRCLRQEKALLCESLCPGDREAGEGPRVRSIICALLGHPGKPLGVLYLDRGISQEAFTTQDLQTVDAIAGSISLGIESVRLLLAKQRSFFMQTMLALAQAVDCRDPYTAGHSQRVTDYALLLAEEVQVSSADYHTLQIGTPLHDIGKIGIDDAVLRKNGKLSAEEFEHIKQHPMKGVAILEPIPQMAPVLPIVRNHHEHWNGRGYPDGLAGEQIPHLARLVTVADVFDALTSERSYHRALPAERALEIIKEAAGSHFDPELAQAFIRLRGRLQQMVSERVSFTETVSRQELQMIRKEQQGASCA